MMFQNILYWIYSLTIPLVQDHKYKYCRNFTGVNVDILQDLSLFIRQEFDFRTCHHGCMYFATEVQRYANASYIYPYLGVSQRFEEICTIPAAIELCD